jgi:hypothetical protein
MTVVDSDKNIKNPCKSREKLHTKVRSESSPIYGEQKLSTQGGEQRVNIRKINTQNGKFKYLINSKLQWKLQITSLEHQDYINHNSITN